MHIVEELITERARKLMAKPKLWRMVRPPLYKALGYAKAVHMADAVAEYSGRQAFEHVSQMLALRPDIKGTHHIPPSGPLIIISNHPTGLADGIFVYDALKTIRPDHMFMANADALRVIEKAEDIIIPVEWVVEKRSPAKARETLRVFKSALVAGKAVVIFPSGVLAKLGLRGLVEKPWNATAISMAKKHNIPIVPLRIKSRNSGLYYLFSVLNNELRDITLFHELLNKRGQSPLMTFGPVIDPSKLPKGSGAATAQVRKIVEGL
ncbi:MAG: acyltransferase [Robiginitomaculum sp.]|nr:MAG: acyltransferase [Robiginitomaculum sp.]